MKLKQLREAQSSQVQTEFEELTDRLDKFRLVLIYPELRCLLSNRDDEYFRLIQKAFALTYKMKIENEAISLISNNVDGGERAAYAKQIFKDMHFIYDEFMDMNKELENKLYAMRQKRDAAAARRMAESSQDMDYVSKIEERAAKAGGFDAPPSDNGDDAPPPKLIFITSDLGVLEAQKRGEKPNVEQLYEDAEIDEEIDKEGDDGRSD